MIRLPGRRAKERRRREPPRPERLQAIVVFGVGFSIAVIPASQVVNADHPAAAAGIALQTVVGLMAAIQLWANSASDALVRWTARQIAINRWHVFGLFDGRIRSLLIATGWLLLGLIAVRIPLGWTPNDLVAWLLVIPILLLFTSSMLIYVVAVFMMIGAMLTGRESPPDGEAVTALHHRLTANDWVWPLLGVAFFVGGILQIAAA